MVQENAEEEGAAEKGEPNQSTSPGVFRAGGTSGTAWRCLSKRSADERNCERLE
jgi:hypothetical protein